MMYSSLIKSHKKTLKVLYMKKWALRGKLGNKNAYREGKLFKI